MHWSIEETRTVEPGVHEFTFRIERVVQLQRVTVEPPGSRVQSIRLGHDVIEHQAGWINPPLVIVPGTLATIAVKASQSLATRVACTGVAVPTLSREEGQSSITSRECAKILGATLGGLAMVADEGTLREALSWWAWHPHRLHLVYEANEELAKLDALHAAQAAHFDGRAN